MAIKFLNDGDFPDNAKIRLGDANDLEIYHDTSNSRIENNTGHLYIRNDANNSDIIFQSDDGGGSVATYFFLDGSEVRTTSNKNFRFIDSALLELGTSGDLQIFHNSTDSFIDNYTGDLTIRNRQDDGDIIFTSDDGSGGLTEYFRVDGGENRIVYSIDSRYLDNVKSMYGTGADLQIYHDGTDSRIYNNAGDFVIRTTQDDGDMKFQNDDGSGNVTDYYVLDGGLVANVFYKRIKLIDNVQLQIGSNPDLLIYHDGSNSYINEDGTGDLYIQTNGTNMFLRDKSSGDTFIAMNTGTADVVLKQSGNTKLTTTSTGVTVTGGIEVGGASSRFSNSVRFTANATFDDNSKAIFGDDSDLQIYHDGSNSYIDDAGTGWIRIRGNGGVLLESYSEGETMVKASRNGSVELYYDNSKKFETTSTGGTLTGALTVTGDVLDRDIPCLFNSNFFDGTSSSIFVVPFNSLSEVTVSSRTYYHNLTMPYAGKLVKVVMKNVSGTLSTGFTTQLFLYVNGSQQASSAELSLSNSAVTWTPTSSNTFSAGDELTFGYQKSASGKSFEGVSFGVAVELTDYDI